MKVTTFAKAAASAACACILVLLALPASAQDEAPAQAAGDEEKTEAAEGEEKTEAKAEGLPEAKQDKFFFPLVRCDEIRDATVEVFKPGAEGWAPAYEKKFYPLGSAFRVVPGAAGPARVAVTFGTGSRVLVTNAAEFATRPVAIGDDARFLELRAGRIEVSLPRVLKDGLFTVAAPYFACSNLAGDSQFEYKKLDDGDEAVIRVVTGSLAVKGSHFEIVRMGAANRVRIRTTKDELFTSIRGESGDCLVKLDQGLVAQKDYETGETKDIAKTLDFQLSPLCAIKIYRATSPIGGRRVVSMMTFAPNGQMKNRCAFAENRSNVNSGELVVTTSAIKDADRKASDSEAEATEAVEVAAPAKKDDEGEAASDDSKEDDSKKEEKKEDSSDDI